MRLVIVAPDLSLGDVSALIRLNPVQLQPIFDRCNPLGCADREKSPAAQRHKYYPRSFSWWKAQDCENWRIVVPRPVIREVER